jgi:hypothetical protein
MGLGHKLDFCVACFHLYRLYTALLTSFLMTITPEHQIAIHCILEQMITGLRGRPGMIFLHEGNAGLGISREEGKFLRGLMAQEGLIVNSDGATQNHLSTWTVLGENIARSPGGYLAHIQKIAETQQREQQEKDDQAILNRRDVEAAEASAKGTRISNWIAGFAALVAVVAALIAYQANTQSSDANARIEKLDAQINQLQSKPVATAPQPKQTAELADSTGHK